MIPTSRFLMLLALLTPTAAGASLVPAQDATPKKDVVQDDARKRPQGERKKVPAVKDGKPVKGKVVDGKPVKGKPVKGKPTKKTDAKPDDELLNALDLEKLLNKSQEDMAAELRKQLEEGAKAQKAKAGKMKVGKPKTSSSSSSSTKRKVVVNGETVVDEETKDGKPVKGKQPAKRPAKGKVKDSDSSSSSSSSSQIRRIVIVNGKTVVDELIVDGDAGSVDLGKLLKDIDLDNLLKGIDLDLPADVKDHVRDELKRQLDDMKKKPAAKGKKAPVVIKKKRKAV